MSIKSLISLFLQRLATATIDDVRGGKVTVMGVLETRSVSFDAVIIADFNDSNVPKKSDKDMFLNTKIREMANLPTMNDRESLQKHYYEMLISRCKEVAISYVNSSESSGSRFLKQLNIKEENHHSELDYANILFKRSVSSLKDEKEIVLEYSFRDKKLSPTSVNTFLTCKRKYYYKYIENLNSHEIPKDIPKEYEIGNSVHLALSNLYSKKNSYSSAEELKRDLYKELDFVCGESELDKYLIEMQKRKMDLFCQREVDRFSQGWQVESCEQNLECNFAGTTINGRIDRIDKRENEIYVLDYKTGKYKIYSKDNVSEATDFQLEFYYLLVRELGNVVGCGYYDLQESKIVDELFMEEKLALLESNIKTMLKLEEINFKKCEDVKNCKYCDYAIVCGR